MSSSAFLSMNAPQDGGAEERAMSDINTTPLVDVMLVLLIVFMITVPVITQTVPLNLPKVENIPTETKPENITIAVNSQGQIYWNMALVNNEQLLAQFDAIARQQPQPEVHVRADQNTRYEFVGRVIVDAQRKGIQKVGFITEPEGRGAQ